MTNAELISKIRAEIERQIKDPLEYCYGVSSINKLREILDFIDSLAEKSEKPINPADAMKELEEKIALVKQRGTWDGVDVDKFMDEVRGREPEKPVPNDLDFEQELYNHFGQVKDFTLGMRIGQYFYELGKQSGSSELPNDLEEAAEKHASMHPLCNGKPAKNSFIAGAEWQKEQMMKEAVEGEVVQDLKGVNRVKSFSKIPEWLHFGDKVRIIIVKEDEK